MNPKDELRGLIDEIFGAGTVNVPPKPPAPKTTDKPEITRFMLQMMNEFAPDADAAAGLRWAKTFNQKASGKKYAISIELREIP